jgi:hypothetical protein
MELSGQLYLWYALDRSLGGFQNQSDDSAYSYNASNVFINVLNNEDIQVC